MELPELPAMHGPATAGASAARIVADAATPTCRFITLPRPGRPQVVTIGGLRVGVCHGHQVVPWGDREALAILQRRLDCDVLVTGHTHVSAGGGLAWPLQLLGGCCRLAAFCCMAACHS